MPGVAAEVEVATAEVDVAAAVKVAEVEVDVAAEVEEAEVEVEEREVNIEAGAISL